MSEVKQAEKPKVRIVAFADEYSRNAEEHLKYFGERNIPISIRSFSFDDKSKLDDLGELTGQAFKDREGVLKAERVIKHITQATEDELIEYKRLMEKYGVEAWDIGSALGKQYIGDADFHTNFLSSLLKTVEVAKFFDTQLIRSFTLYPGTKEELENTIHGNLPALYDKYQDKADAINAGYSSILEGFGLVPVLEVESNLYGHDGPSLKNIADDMPFEQFMYFDGGNMVQQITDDPDLPHKTFMDMKDYLLGVHVKDMKLSDKSTAGAVDEGADWPYVPVGEGDAQYDKVFADLAKMIPGIQVRLEENGLEPEVAVVLEPHLICGGQFGGFTGRKMDDALNALTKMLDTAGIGYQKLERQS